MRSLKRELPAVAASPTALEPQYPPALERFTTGFGMGPGGAVPHSTTGSSRLPLTQGRVLAARRAVKGEQPELPPALGGRHHYAVPTDSAPPRFRTISAVARERFRV